MSEIEIRRERALAHLDLYERVVIAGAARIAETHRKLSAAGVDLREWDRMDCDERYELLRKLRRARKWA